MKSWQKWGTLALVTFMLIALNAGTLLAQDGAGNESATIGRSFSLMLLFVGLGAIGVVGFLNSQGSDDENS